MILCSVTVCTEPAFYEVSCPVGDHDWHYLCADHDAGLLSSSASFPACSVEVAAVATC